MKLIGSRKEQQMRDELVRSNLALQDDSYRHLASVLETANMNIAGAYVLNWIPEQAEDIYTLLVSAGEVATVEVPRGEGKILLQREQLSKYESKCSKVQRLKIAVAQQLLASKTAGQIVPSESPLNE